MRLTNESGDWDAVLDEGETIAYSGPCLAELLGAGEMRALPVLEPEPEPEQSIEQSIEQTVVIPGFGSLRPPPSPASYEPATRSSVTIAPVAYTLSHAVPTGRVEPEPRGIALRIGGGFSLAAAGVLLGLFVGSSFLGDPHDVRSGLAPQVQQRERVDEKVSLVLHSRQKAPSRRQAIVPPGSGRSAFRSMTGTASAAAAVASPASDQAASDAELIRAAQLERPF